MAAAHLAGGRNLLSAQSGRGGYMMQPPDMSGMWNLAATKTTANASMFNNAVNAAYGLQDTNLRVRGELANTSIGQEWGFRTAAMPIPSSLSMSKYSSDSQLELGRYQADAQLRAAAKAAKAQKSSSLMGGLGTLASAGLMAAFPPAKPATTVFSFGSALGSSTSS